MNHQAHFGSACSPREAAQTTALITDLNRIVQSLTAEIAEEERKSGISDSTLSEYPMIARAMMNRRNNLQRTIAALEQRLGEFQRAA
jgi:hypothetical protein